MNIKKAIVTGANGFIGSNTIKYLLAQGIEVVAVCHNGNSSSLPKSDRVKIIDLDMAAVTDLTKYVNIGEADVFYHFAWQGSAGRSRGDAMLQLENIVCSVNAVKAAYDLNCKKIVMAGSIMEREVVAAANQPGMQLGLGYIYSGSKFLANVACKSMAAALGIEYVSGMITNAYGIGEISERMLNTTIRKCIQGQAPTFTAAEQNYDFVYIDDVARAFYLIGKNGHDMHDYLIGSSGAKPLKEFLLEMQSVIAPEIDFKFGDIPFAGVNLPLEAFDCSKTEHDTGFKAEIPFKEGIKRTWQWLLKTGDNDNDTKF